MRRVLDCVLSIYEYLVFYLGMLLFGLLCLSASLLGRVLYPLLPAVIGQRLGRRIIRTVFRVFLAVLTLSGRFRFDLRELDALRKEESLIIAANHPSLWDVVLIVSRLPNVACIMKGELLDNPFLGGGAHLARYIGNASARRMIMLAVSDVQCGSQLLVFPEGTRTDVHAAASVGPFRGSIGTIARRARAPVQTVLIETDSPFLAKGWPVYKKPRLPIACRVRLGRRFEACDHGPALVTELEQYFAAELSSTVPPATPNSRHLGPMETVAAAEPVLLDSY
jgi:1-acyl-sn-glycerol-3-phosphate acyltransferase